MSRDQPKRLFVGTSGYSYKHWTQGAFYPKGLKSRDQLSYYATHFKTVEVNMSFYRRPTVENLERWAQVTPDDFIFAAKMNRYLTHYQKLKVSAETLAGEKILLDGLGTKLAVVLAQLPPNLSANHDLLKSFLDLLGTQAGGWIPRLTVEFRHPSWLTDRTRRLLDEYGVGLCLADWGECMVVEPNHAKFVYIRRHGGRDNGNYTSEQIRDDADLIRKQLKKGKKVFVYYNNDLNAYAVKNARELIEALGPAE